MAQTSTQLDTAYAKLHRYASYEFRALGKEDAQHLEASAILREVVARLRKRPDMLRCVFQASLHLPTILTGTTWAFA